MDSLGFTQIFSVFALPSFVEEEGPFFVALKGKFCYPQGLQKNDDNWWSEKWCTAWIPPTRKKNWQRGSKKELADEVAKRIGRWGSKKDWQRGGKMAFDGYFCTFFPINLVVTEKDYIFARSEERRVGKECF